METCVTSLQPQSLSAVLPRLTAGSVNIVLGRWLFTRQLCSGSYAISDTRHLLISVHRKHTSRRFYWFIEVNINSLKTAHSIYL